MNIIIYVYILCMHLCIRVQCIDLKLSYISTRLQLAMRKNSSDRHIIKVINEQ